MRPLRSATGQSDTVAVLARSVRADPKRLRAPTLRVATLRDKPLSIIINSLGPRGVTFIFVSIFLNVPGARAYTDVR